MQHPNAYRREVDGLRAVAVLPVVFFHADFQAVAGGYVGVDVFFVISGYLITSIILADLERGRFSIATFYERRARRILPALFAVMLACVPFAWAWMLPYQFEDFAQSLDAVALFASNVLFLAETDYFQPSAELKPLLHTWSLAVEEQFYVVFPLFAALCWRAGRRVLVGASVLVLLASLALTQVGGNFNLHRPYIDPRWDWWNVPEWAFFLAPTRAWELLIGALIAYHHRLQPGHELPARWAEWGGALGLALIGWAVFAFDRSTPFPSVYALAPTLGTGLVLLCATPGTRVGRMLGQPWLVGIGLISYSLYLWHQPLFAFARLRGVGTPGVLTMLAFASVALAYLSWRYVETPFRDRNVVTRRQVFTVAVAGTAAIIAAGLAGQLDNGFESRYAQKDRDLIVSPAERGAYVSARHRELRRKGGFTPAAQKRLAVIGDSYSEDFVNMIHEARAFEGYEIRAFYVPTVCQIHAGDEAAESFIAESDRPGCRRINASRMRELAAAADVVIFVAAWRDWAVERFPATLRHLDLPASKQVYVVGRKNFGFIQPVLRFAALTHEQRAQVTNPVVESHLQTNRLMHEVLAGVVTFVDLHAAICGADSPHCPLFTPEGLLISHDGRHLTRAGARHIGEKLFSTPPLDRYRPAP